MKLKKMGRVGVAVVAIATLFAVGRVVSLRGSQASPAQSSQDRAEEVKVTIDNFSFTPQDVTVKAGTTVTWVNQDDVPHTVVSNDKKFKSKALDTDDKFSFTFNDPGTYEYYCSVHPKMTAKVTVK
jgi:plastocyanin